MENVGVNNSTIALNVLYVKKINLYPAYISKHNLDHENQVIIFMHQNGEGLHLAVKKYLHYSEE